MPQQFRWKPKKHQPNQSNDFKPINSNSRSKSISNRRQSWIPTQRLEAERIEELVTFFSAKFHSPRDMANVDDYIRSLLVKVTSKDVTSDFNKYHASKAAKQNGVQSRHLFRTVSIPSGFSPLCHCVSQIAKSWGIKSFSTQKFVVSQWMKIINILFEYKHVFNTNFLRCKHCQDDKLTIYTQHHKCRSSYGQHVTAVQILFKSLRFDFRHSRTTAEPCKIHEIHRNLYILLKLGVQTTHTTIPLVRLLEHHKRGQRNVYISLPAFPTVDMLKNLFSIQGVVPFMRIRSLGREVGGYQELGCNIDDSDAPSSWQHRIPLAWQTCSCFAEQQAFAENLHHVLEETQPDLCIFERIFVELLFSTLPYRGLCVENVSSKEMQLEALYRMYLLASYDGDVKKADRYSVVSQAKQMCHRVSEAVYRSWADAFQGPQHRFFKNVGTRTDVSETITKGLYHSGELCSLDAEYSSSPIPPIDTEHYCLQNDLGLGLWRDYRVAEFIKNNPEHVFELVRRYRAFFKYVTYQDYEEELGFGSFYEDIVFIANEDPLLCYNLIEKAKRS